MNETNGNLALWESVEKTDPNHTKKAKIGQMNITAVSPQYQRKQATEKFGPYGIGWGLINESFDFIDFENQTKLVTYHATLWYMLDGKRGEFPVTSNGKVAFVTQGGKGYLKIDDEYAKKVQTDALTKGLSFLGFNADIFMGLYDDNKYVNQMIEEFAPPKAAPAPSSKAQQDNITNLAEQLSLDEDRLSKSLEWASGGACSILSQLSQTEAAKLVAELTRQIQKK